MGDWNVRADWRNAACTLLAFLIYSAPWILLQSSWPIYIPRAEQRFPAPAITLAIGLGGTVALVALLVFAVPHLLAWTGWDDLAWRWRGGALHAAWFALVVTAVHVGLRLPLPGGLQVGVILVLAAASAFALRRLGA
jgi:hypothetical protein